MRQTRLALIFAVCSGLCAAPAFGQAPPPPSGSMFAPDKFPPKSDPSKQVTKRAKKIERLPGSITLKRGKKASYKGGIAAAAVMDPSIAEAVLDEGGVLTVRALKAGSTKLMVFSGKNGIPNPETAKSPRQISLRVVP